MRSLLLALAILVLVLPVEAQEKQSWKKLRKEAEAFAEEFEYEKAAKAYSLAYEAKPKKEELAFLAAENYFQARDYRNASASYRLIVEDTKNFPLANLNYARSLKSEGNYEAAIRALRKLSGSYDGAGKEKLERVIQHEILGAQMAGSMALQEGMRVVYPGKAINSPEEEFAPAMLSDLLLFSSTREGRAQVYSATPQPNGGWVRGGMPENFPVISEGHFGNAALSPDGSTLYFTLCDAETPYRVKDSPCEIYYVTRTGQQWGRPQRLPSPINLEGTTNTHPAVAHKGDTEILYFSSNRAGGSGEMDLWYATRNLGASVISFSAPVNLGPSINTIGDEITPFYDNNAGALYFATNGHPTIGGFDVYYSQGDMRSWGNAIHAGKPINSPADDYYYNFFGARAFIASNRPLAGMRTGTTDDDIFSFILPGRPVMLSGEVLNEATQTPLLNASVTVYESSETGRSLVGSQNTASGGYQFEVVADKTYSLEISAPEFLPTSYTVSTTDPNLDVYGQPVFLSPVPVEEEPVATQPVMPEEPIASNTPLPVIDDSGNEYTATGMGTRDNFEYISTATRYEGRYYKIQLVATAKSLSSYRYKLAPLEGIGHIDTEYLIRQKWTRILVGDFFSESEALNALDQIRSNGFRSAFIVEYQDGVRYGRINM